MCTNMHSDMSIKSFERETNFWMKQQNIHIENGGEKKLKSFFQLRCSITGITNGLGCNKRQVQCP